MVILMKKYLFVVFILTIFLSGELFSQTFFYGGKLGLSLAGTNEVTPKLGLQVGGAVEYVTSFNLGFGSELNWNTQAGNPIELAILLKYYFETNIKGLKPFLGIGGDMWFVDNGPYFGTKVTAGMDMQLGRHFIIPLEIQFGQVFYGDENVDYFAGSTGIKFIF